MRFPMTMISVLALAGGMFLTGAVELARAQSCPAITDPQPLNTNANSDGHSDSRPQFATDGAGNWVAVWASQSDLDGTIGNDLDILFARSTDNGATWTDPEPLNSNAAVDGFCHDGSSQVTTDGMGNWVVVWSSGCFSVDDDIMFSRSFDSGTTWSAAEPLNTNAASDSGDDLAPQLTTDGSGTWLAVWKSFDDLGGTLGAGFNILFARSTDSGATWTDPGPLNTTAVSGSGSDSWPQLSTDGTGNWVAVWTSTDDLDGTIGTDWDILFAHSADDGANWTDPLPLNTNATLDSGVDKYPQLTTDGAGNWVAVWWSTDDLGGSIDTDTDILFARSTNSGVNWTYPQPLNTNAALDIGGDGAPQLTTDGSGNWVAVWHSTDDLGGTIEDDADILFSRSTDSGATWTEPLPLNTDAASDQVFDHTGDVDPQLATDQAGNWLAIWSSSNDFGGTLGTDLDVLFASFELTADDCNDNNIPDECDIADGTSADGNVNGIPDECDECLDDSDCGNGQLCVDGLCVPDPLCIDDDGDGKVVICHIPPGNPDNARTHAASVNAVPVHLAHGDHCGPCEGDDG
ncbi:MAG: exo-alpha-sialidase [Planctomycetes bacterium]|nr:exo-alpha-sialidase [Planctomycetota bacterium]